MPFKRSKSCKLLLAAAMLSSSVWAQDLRIATYTDITGLDPHDTSATPTMSVQSGIFERLFQFDPTMKVIPVLATGYTQNENATQFTISLREGVTFHDKTPFNAAAVKANLERLANQENHLKRNSLFRMISNVRVIDDYTVEINLKEPFGAMINTLAHPSAVMWSPKSLQEKTKNELRLQPVGTGPFQFVEWKPGSYIDLDKNPNYWKQGWPKVDGVTFYPTPEASTRQAKLQGGEVDAIYFLPSDLAESVTKNGKLSVQQDPGIMLYYVAINNLKAPLDNKLVRQAMNYAINKDIWLKVVFGGMGTKATSAIPEQVQFYSKQSFTYGYDLKKAKALMKEAGLADGFSIELWTANSTDEIRSAQIIKQQLSQIGIKVKVIPMEAGTRNQRLWGVQNPKDAKFDMYLSGWSTSTGDADWALRPLFATESWIPTAFNVSYYSNPAVDNYISAALATADPTVRSEAYKQAQTLIWNDAPVIFLGEPDNLVGKVKALEGVYMLPDRSLSFTDAEFRQ